MNDEYGLISPPSTASSATFIALKTDVPTPIVGRLVFFDTEVGDDVYRSVGTVTDITTSNNQYSNQYESFIAGKPMNNSVPDLRKSTVRVQAVFRRPKKGGTWAQYGAALPTSPATNARVCLMDEDTIQDMLENADYPAVGFFRGMEQAPLPFNIPNFDRSASHSAVLGRSGSGKTQLYAMVLGAYMSHEDHAVMVIDPQGQWSNENGMIFSPQNFARGLGRKVSNLKVAQDIRLPMEYDVLTRMITKLDPWTKFRRMGMENRQAFSDYVARSISNMRQSQLDRDIKIILTEIFQKLANSVSDLGRIYVPGDTQDNFRDDLKRLIGEPIYNDEGEEAMEDTEGSERTWEVFLSIFQPLHSLFQSKNINGGKRQPLGGDNGFLTDFFQVRESNPTTPAPYVILDMSPDVALQAKAGLEQNNDTLNMQKLLDNEDIKALILQMIMREMKRASEQAFATGGGLLNTQIVFDEAWRYAPEGKSTPEITELADMLEGFALDTRKFGIGWTYILQTPSDLRRGIWRQLTYVYAGYGLIGEDVRALETLSDDPKQLDLYRQFIAPAATRIYPMMVLGPISPLIFTTAPSFMNAFNGTPEFLKHNESWIKRITRKRQLPTIDEAFMTATVVQPRIAKKKDATEVKEYRVGKTYEVSEPQVKSKPSSAQNLDTLLTRVPELVITDDEIGDTPF